MKLLEKPRDPPLQHVVVDTPGQIEIFTWSASGSIVTELLVGERVWMWVWGDDVWSISLRGASQGPL
eukprot:350754-Chlamydomonas_euryale.AAC.1